MDDTIYNIRKENLVKAIGEKYKTINKFAKSKDIEAAPIYKMHSGRLKMGEKAARQYEKLLGLEPYALDLLDDSTNKRKNVYVPLYEVGSFASYTNIFPESQDKLPVPTVLISSKKLIIDNLIALQINDSSMSNTINEGAYIVVNTNNKEIVDGKVYALRKNNGAIVRRIFRTIEGFTLTPDNSNFPMEVLNILEESLIVGKVEIVFNML